jgi:hypothetical protein
VRRLFETIRWWGAVVYLLTIFRFRLWLLQREGNDEI